MRWCQSTSSCADFDYVDYETTAGTCWGLFDLKAINGSVCLVCWCVQDMDADCAHAGRTSVQQAPLSHVTVETLLWASLVATRSVAPRQGVKVEL